MFTKVKLKNFKCFDQIELDLTDKGKDPKSLALLYGENGAGKSNLISAFVLLKELLNTMNVRDFYERLFDRSASDHSTLDENVRRQLLSSLRDIPTIIDDYRMIGSDDPVTAEFEFSIGGNIGTYILKLGKEEIIYEKLEFLLNKRRGVYFECLPNSIKVNSKIILNKALEEDINQAAKRFWGKHSMFAIILHEIQEKSKAFAEDNLSENFNHVLGKLLVLSCELGIGSRHFGDINAPLFILEHPSKGKISLSDEHQLDLVEQMLSKLFSIVTTDTLKTYYDKEYNEKNISYELYMIKKIGGKSRTVPFSRESAGTHKLLTVFCYLLCACAGGTVVLDEMDSKIHDLLFKQIITAVKPALSSSDGQLIIATHNTALMEEDYSRNAVYIVQTDDTGHKSAKCINSAGERVYQQNNIRTKYMNMAYGGVPSIENAGENIADVLQYFAQEILPLADTDDANSQPENPV